MLNSARRNARWYFTGLIASLVGDSAMSLAAGIWVKTLTGSNAAAGLVSVGIYAPSLLAPVFGLLADRVRRRPLLVVTQLAMAAALPVLLLVRDAQQVWLIYAAMLLYGIALAVIDPAENALFVVMFRSDIRARLNGIRMTVQEGSKLVAPLVGAGLFALAGGGTVALLDAGTFLIAAFALTRLTVVETTAPAVERGWRREFTGGFAHLRHDTELRSLTVAAAVAMAASGVAFAAVYAQVEAVHRPPSFVGVTTAMLGAGSIVAGMLSGRMIGRHGEATVAGLGVVNGTAGYLLGSIPWLPTVLAGAFVRGFALPWVVVAAINLTQRRTPDVLQGRVFAVVGVALFAPQPLAQLIGALLVAHVDYRVIYLGAAACGILTVRWLRWRPDRMAPARRVLGVAGPEAAQHPAPPD